MVNEKDLTFSLLPEKIHLKGKKIRNPGLNNWGRKEKGLLAIKFNVVNMKSLIFVYWLKILLFIIVV